MSIMELWQQCSEMKERNLQFYFIVVQLKLLNWSHRSDFEYLNTLFDCTMSVSS